MAGTLGSGGSGGIGPGPSSTKTQEPEGGGGGGGYYGGGGGGGGNEPTTGSAAGGGGGGSSLVPAGGSTTVAAKQCGPSPPQQPRCALVQITYNVPLPTVTKVEPTRGPASGGTSVTITGTGFSGATAVKFGSTNATSFTVNSATSITAVSPPGAGTADVTVTTPAGTSPTSAADQFTYEPATIRAEFTNWVLSGALTLKKINQPITLPAGAVFNGSAELSRQTLSGPLTGSVTIPPFNAVVKILGIPATIGLEFSEVGSVEGSLERSKTLPRDLSLSVPTRENISFTTIQILRLHIATKCQTTKPLSLPLLAELSASELLATGAHFMGTTTIPPVKCEGSLGTLESAVLTSLFSGPANPYSVAIAPPS
jgi:hypothetical protein